MPFVKGNSLYNWVISLIWVDWDSGKGKFSTEEQSKKVQPLQWKKSLQQ